MAPDETKPTGPDLSQGIPLDRLARNEGAAWHDRSTQFLTFLTLAARPSGTELIRYRRARSVLETPVCRS
jgi:hypothetical protein